MFFFVFREKWEKKNIRFHSNGTLTFNQEKIYMFEESLSVGMEDDVVVVPNIPMLVSKAHSFCKVLLCTYVIFL